MRTLRDPSVRRTSDAGMLPWSLNGSGQPFRGRRQRDSVATPRRDRRHHGPFNGGPYARIRSRSGSSSELALISHQTGSPGIRYRSGLSSGPVRRRLRPTVAPESGTYCEHRHRRARLGEPRARLFRGQPPRRVVPAVGVAARARPAQRRPAAAPPPPGGTAPGMDAPGTATGGSGGRPPAAGWLAWSPSGSGRRTAPAAAP